MFARKGFTAHGQIRAWSAKIGGQFELDRAKLHMVGVFSRADAYRAR